MIGGVFSYSIGSNTVRYRVGDNYDHSLLDTIALIGRKQRGLLRGSVARFTFQIRRAGCEVIEDERPREMIRIAYFKNGWPMASTGVNPMDRMISGRDGYLLGRKKWVRKRFGQWHIYLNWAQGEIIYHELL